MAIYIRFDRTYDNYERKVYDLLTFLGDVGGLKSALMSIGMFFVGYLAEKVFFSNLIRKIYQLRKYEVFENQT